MQIFIKTLVGSSFSLDVEETHTIKAVKKQIYGRLSIAPEQQRLTLAGKPMDDTLTLADYKLRGSSLLSMAKSQGAMAKLMMDNRTIVLEVCENNRSKVVEEATSVETLIAQNVARTAYLTGRDDSLARTESKRDYYRPGQSLLERPITVQTQLEAVFAA